MSFSGTCFRFIVWSNGNLTFLQTSFLLYLSLMLMFPVLDVEMDVELDDLLNDELDVELDDVKSIVLSVVCPRIIRPRMKNLKSFLVYQNHLFAQKN